MFCRRKNTAITQVLAFRKRLYGENGGKEKAFDHPLYLLLHDEPNPEMSSFNFRETLMGHLLLYGNAYAQIIRNGKGEVVGLYPLIPSKMTVDRDSRGRLYYLYTRGADDSPVGSENGQVYLPPEQVLHIPGLGYDGIAASAASVIAMAGTTVLMAPTALMMVHNPLTVAIGDSVEMLRAVAMLGEVKESVINAYEIKTGLSRVRLSHLMDAETWLSGGILRIMRQKGRGLMGKAGR